MRIKITLRPIQQPTFLPLNNYPFAALIYKSIKLVNPKIANLLHEEGYLISDSISDKKGKRFKLFVFSRPQAKGIRIENNKAYFSSPEVVWQVSSPVTDLIEYFVAGLLTQNVIRLTDYYDSNSHALFKISNIESIATPIFTKNKTRFLTISPITSIINKSSAEKQYKYYIRAEEDLFGQVLATNLLEKYQAFNGQFFDEQNVHFEFDWQYACRKWGYSNFDQIKDIELRNHIKKSCSEKMSKLVQYKDINIKAYQTPFFITASPQLLRFGWDCGFGMNNSQGFGMVEIG
jgi:CRISPR-associated endoribonuclease Cas6